MQHYSAAEYILLPLLLRRLAVVEFRHLQFVAGPSFHLFGEGRELQFRADSFNVFNHTQWASIDTSPGNGNYILDDRQINAQSTFGSITAGRPGRRMQLNMRFVF